MKKSFVTKKEAYMLSYALFSVFTFPIIAVFYANLEHFALTSFCVVSVVAAVYTVSALIFGTLLWKFRRSRFSAVIGYLAPGIAVSVIIEYYFSGRFFPDYIGEALDIEDRILLFGAHMFVVTIPLISA